MSKRLGIFVTHPIQYFAPMWRRLARDPGLSLRVHFFSDHSIRGGEDPDFKVPVAWDCPILDGYEHCFLRRDADLSRPWSVALPNAAAVLQAGQFDWVMIHGYTNRFEIQIIGAARSLGIPVFQRGEFSDGNPAGTKWYRRLLRGAYLKWFYSHIERFGYIGVHAREHLLRHGVREEKLFFSPYSVDSDLFEAQYERLDREECRRQLGIDADQFVVLFSGKFIPRKDPFVLLDALARLASRERVTLLMLGDGDLRQALQERARAILGDRAIFPGFVNQTQLGRYFRAADVFVLPSRFETWGLVVNEAMLFGLPALVAPTVGCAADLIRPGQTGFVFPLGDADTLAAQLQQLLTEPELCRRMGQAGRQHVHGYSPDVSADGIKEALGVHSSLMEVAQAVK